MSTPKPCFKCMERPDHSRPMWIGLIGFALLMEAVGLRRQQYEHTLSHNTRYVFQTQKTPGKAAFVVAWASLTAWFLPHILRSPKK